MPIPRTSKRTLIEVTGEEKDVDEIENDEESIIKEPKYETEDEDIEVLDEGIESGGIDDLGINFNCQKVTKKTNSYISFKL